MAGRQTARGRGDDDTGAFKRLTEAAVRDYTDSGSFSRGKSYYRSGYISGTYRRGATIGGACEGSQAEAYRVEMTLAPIGEPGDDALRDWECSCPRGGFCKHVVALALTWIAAPEQFAPRQGLGELLADQGREQLVALIERLLAHEPDLYAIVERTVVVPAPAGVTGAAVARPALDPVRVRGQAAAVFRDSRYDRYEWGASLAIASGLAQLRGTADAYAAAGRWSDAQTVYAAVATEAIAHYEELHDEGDVSAEIAACATGLGRCLDAQATLDPGERLDAAARAELIEALYAIWQYDVEFGGIDLASDAPAAIARGATAEEQATVERWVRAAIVPGDDFHRRWQNRALASFLILLREQAGAGDEEVLEEYRLAGLHDERAAMLLDLGRADEALAVARRHLTGHQEVTTFATALLARGGEWRSPALALVEDRLFESKDKDGGAANDHYLGWLGQQYAAHGLADKALDVALRRLRATPSAHAYEEVKTSAHLPGQPADRWPALRRDLLLTLEQRGAWAALIDIFLREGEPGEALTALGELEGRTPTTLYGYYGDQSSYQIRVAEAAERDYPDRARDIYRRVADRLIEGRNRHGYHAAAGYLARVKRLYEAEGRAASWREEIATLRARTKTLRALKEELNAAGLE